MNKKTRLQTGIFALVLVGVVGFYEYRLREYKNMTSVECWQLKKGLTVTKGQDLKSNMFYKVKKDKATIPEDYIANLDNVDNEVALDNFYDDDILRSKKVTDKKKWCKDTERIVWISGRNDEVIAGNDLRPGDTVDVLIYDPTSRQYIDDQNFDALSIIDLKDKDAVSYFNTTNKTFITNSLCFKLDNKVADDLVNKIKNSNNDFKITIHGNRPNDARVIKDDNSMIQNLNK